MMQLLFLLCLASQSLAWAPQPVTAKRSTTTALFEQNENKQPFFASVTKTDNGDKTVTKPTIDTVKEEANKALDNVGWSNPFDNNNNNNSEAKDDPNAALTSDDPFVQAIDAGIRRDYGVGLDDLLNPAKVVNLERELQSLRSEIENSSSDKAQLQKTIDKKQADLNIERRAVFRGWLKNVFLGQAVISFGLSYIMATNPAILFGQFGWYSSVYNMDISIMVLGYWWWWLFIVPSLRSRRPKGTEKQALDIAFLATPAISLLAPVATRDTELIWYANLVVVLASYAYANIVGNNNNDDDSNNDDSKQPEWLKFVFKSLDFGSGRERGARQ